MSLAIKKKRIKEQKGTTKSQIINIIEISPLFSIITLNYKHLLIIEKAREFQKNIYFYFIDYAKVFVWITTNYGKFLKRWEYQTILPTSWEICMHIKKQHLEPDKELQTSPNWERSTSRLYIVTLLI